MIMEIMGFPVTGMDCMVPRRPLGKPVSPRTPFKKWFSRLFPVFGNLGRGPWPSLWISYFPFVGPVPVSFILQTPPFGTQGHLEPGHLSTREERQAAALHPSRGTKSILPKRLWLGHKWPGPKWPGPEWLTPNGRVPNWVAQLQFCLVNVLFFLCAPNPPQEGGPNKGTQFGPK